MPPVDSLLGKPSAGGSSGVLRGGGALKATSRRRSANSIPLAFDTASAAALSSSYSMYARPFGLPSLKQGRVRIVLYVKIKVYIINSRL